MKGFAATYGVGGRFSTLSAPGQSGLDERDAWNRSDTGDLIFITLRVAAIFLSAEKRNWRRVGADRIAPSARAGVSHLFPLSRATRYRQRAMAEKPGFTTVSAGATEPAASLPTIAERMEGNIRA